VELSNRILGRDVQLACSYTMLLTQRRQGDARDFKWAYKGGDGTAGTFEPGEELIARGTCRHDLWPNDQPHPRTGEQDLARDATEYRLRAKVMDIAMDDVKKVLSAGSPVWFFMNTGEKFQDIGRDGIYHAAEQPSGQHGCHAMLIVGYAGNYYIVKNSWGEDFGDNGYIYIPKKVLADAEPGFVAIMLETPAFAGSNASAMPSPMQSGGARGEAAAFAAASAGYAAQPAAPRTVTCPYCKIVTQLSPRCPSCGAPR
jgi:hypothetical protein